MHTMRDFSRRLSHFKRLAAAGKRIHLVDRQGKRFIFEAEKPARAYGAGRHLAKGEPLSAERTPPEEWTSTRRIERKQQSEGPRERRK
jgi:hypothetical protein